MGFRERCLNVTQIYWTKWLERKSTMSSELKNKTPKNRTKDKMITGSSTQKTPEETDR